MVDVPFRFRIQGGEADNHRIQAYDGYTSLAGFARSLTLVTNYVETGEIRVRGDFAGRSSVLASAIAPGSVTSDFVVKLTSAAILGAGGVATVAASRLLVDLVKRTLDRNLGIQPQFQTDELRELEQRRGGDLEALVAVTEPSVKQSHAIIGESARLVSVYGRNAVIANYNAETKAYVSGSYRDETIRKKDVSVASFNANSGYGSVFDGDLGRTVPIQLTKDTLERARGVLGWGLNEYAHGTGRRIDLTYFSELALDNTPKKYIVVDAEIPKE